MKYKAIGFDYGGVIVGESISRFYLRLSNILDIDAETIKKVYFQNNYLMNINGESYVDMWKKILVILKKTDKENDVLELIKDEFTTEVNKDVVDIIKILQEKGYITGLISNNSSRINKEIKNAGLEKFFETIVISQDVGCMKPDKRIFDIFCKKINIKNDELIFIDDSDNSLKNANEVGYTPVLFKNVDDLKKKLKELGVL